MDVSDKPINSESLEMVKNRNKKVYITDIAIDKVPLIVSSKSVVVVLLHNHPSTQTFSLEDVQFFIQHPMLTVIVVVSNQGTVHYLKRDKDFDYGKVVVLFKECIQGLKRNSPSSKVYMATLTFLAKCSEAGLYYR